MWLEQFIQDLRFGIRALAKSPGFTAVAVLSLALGIMATTAIYSVIHAVVLEPFIYKDVDSLMSIKVWEPGQRGYRAYYTTDQYLEFRDRSTIFDGVIASTISDVLWTGEGEPQRLRGNRCTTNTFEVMGVPPLIGRAVTPSDGDPGAAPVCVLGYKFWQRQFGGDPRVLGRQMRLDGAVRTVVGVMPRRFMWRGADVYVPIVFRRGETVEGVRTVHVLGRLKPGMNDARAEADLRPVVEDLRRQDPAGLPEKFRVGLLSFKETFPSGIRDQLWILFGAVGLLLLISCANVSNLLLSKATARKQEMALRATLGADRFRLLRQLLTESLALGLSGGVLGVLLAWGAVKAVIALVPPDTIPDESEIVISGSVLLFAFAVSVATAIAFGLAPALHTASTNLANPLRESGRGIAGGRVNRVLRSSLVVVEVALSLVLLAGASLMVRTLMALQQVDIGIQPQRLLTLRVPLSDKRYPERERRNAFYRELLDRLKAVPGVKAVGLNTSMHPLGNWRADVEVGGDARRDSRTSIIHQVDTDYTKAMGIPVLQGRLFNDAEVANARHLALVNELFAKRYFGNREAVGQWLRIPRMRQAPFKATDDSFQVVGVVKDRINRGLTNELMPEVYFPYTVLGVADQLVVLTRAEPASLTNAVRAQVYAIDRDQPVTGVRTMEAVLHDWVFAGPRFGVILYSFFATLGLALAVVGVYGVISHLVSQQTQEIGLRLALGATAGDVLWVVLRRGLVLLGLGIVTGIGASIFATRLLASQVFRVSPFDPLSLALVAAILLAVGLQACLAPAWRAARIDPIRALRYE